MQDLETYDEQNMAQLQHEAASMPVLKLTDRQRCDLKLELDRGFSPLAEFLNEANRYSVLENIRVKSVMDENGDSLPSSISITFGLGIEVVQMLSPGTRIVLQKQRDEKDFDNHSVESVYKSDKDNEAPEVIRGDPEDLAIKYLCDTAGNYYLGVFI